MNCELCGLYSDKFYKAEIEGAVLIVCSQCSRYGKILDEAEINTNENNKNSRTPHTVLREELRPDYAGVISESCKEKKVSLENLCKDILISKSEMKRILAGKLLPSDELIKKFEKYLGIKLTEPSLYKIKEPKSDTTISFEDVVEIKRKPKQG